MYTATGADSRQQVRWCAEDERIKRARKRNVYSREHGRERSAARKEDAHVSDGRQRAAQAHAVPYRGSDLEPGAPRRQGVAHLASTSHRLSARPANDSRNVSRTEPIQSGRGVDLGERRKIGSALS